MARRLRGRLTPLDVTRANKRGLHSDGGGLNLQIAKGGSKSFVFRYRFSGRIRVMGLGSSLDVSLSEARDRAFDCRRSLRDGIDPLRARENRRATQRLQDAKSISFDECSRQYIETNKSAWRNSDHASEWTATLARYASPVFGRLAVQDVDTGLIVRALEPIWTVKPVTASRVRGRIEIILHYAKARGFRIGENPAVWRGNLDHILPHPTRIKAVQHLAAMPHAEVSGLMAKLRGRREISAAALAFTILTAARSGEVTGAQWDEVDLGAKVWTIPGSRMKSGREHRVPLNDEGVAILKKMKAIRQGESGFVFSGRNAGRGISCTGMPILLRRIGIEGVTVHGFRSSFRDWTAEQTAYPREVAEACLAHVVGDRVEAAYRRTDFLERRRKLMDAWATYIATPVADDRHKVIAIRRGS
jgi:integrase